MSEKTTITGEISAISYRKNDGWAVFSVDNQKCTGSLAEICEVGTVVTCTGQYESNKFGRQLKCDSVVPAAPDVNSEAGILRLLQRLPGLGPKKAMLAIQKHGYEKAWLLAGTDPAIIGVRPDMVDQACSIAQSLVVDYQALVYLLGLGLTDYQAGKIIKQFGRNAQQIVAENPYQLTIIDGFGFLTVDAIALRSGVDISNPARIEACILSVLGDAEKNGGHVWHNGWNLADMVMELLTDNAAKANRSMLNQPGKKDVRQAVYRLQAEGKVYISEGRVFSVPLMEAEACIFLFVEAA